jgi:O-antigen/teichoic acid export membrane protein
MVSVGAGFWKMGQQLISDSYKIGGFNGKIVLETAAKYKKFPLFSTMESLVNVAGVQIPLLIINSFVGSGEVGFLMIAMRVMHAPLGLLGSSVSQAYFSRAVEEHRSNNLGNFTAKILDHLARFGVGPILLVGLVAPSVFGKLLGHSWARSGEIILWLTPWHVMQYLASPISLSLHVTGNQKLALMLTAFGFGVRLIAVWAGLYSPMGMGVVKLFAISGAIFYCVCLLVFCKISGVHIEHFATRFKRFFLLIFLYLVIALSFKLLIEKF